MTELTTELRERLSQCLGSDGVVTDRDELNYFSQDVFSSADHQTCAVLVPKTVEALAGAVAAATDAGFAVFPRGGGMSYTGGYLPSVERAVSIDTRAMNRILEVNLEDMYITVECGCSWRDIHEALAGTGVRSPFWGTLSGIKATVGGGLSQNSIFHGSGVHGSAADSVIGLKVVLADGTIVETGSGAVEGGSSFFRHYGPDLTGLFVGDAGALGIKAEVTLRLIADPSARRQLSFNFADHASWLGGLSAVSRQGLASECYGFDPFLQLQAMKRADMAQGLQSVIKLMKQSDSIGRALIEGSKVALAGKRFMKGLDFSLHVSTEQLNEQAASDAEAQIRGVLEGAGGTEIENTIPKIVRADPFPPTNSIIGPDGERWAPVHGILPHSRAVETFEEIEGVLRYHGDEIERFRIGTGYLVTTIGASAMVIEPVFFWPDALDEMQRRNVDGSVLKKVKGFPEDVEARAAVQTIRAAMIDVFAGQGAVHLQIGKTYPYRQGLKPESFALIEEIKKIVDPRGLVNPGALGLARDDS